MAYWTDAEPLTCTSHVPEAPDVTTFSFSAASGCDFNYQPGQFITLTLPLPTGDEYRTYTLSSSPSRPRSISVTVKAQPNSIATRWMLENLRPGQILQAKGPQGDFTLPDEKPRKYLFITAGSGVTPALSMSTYLFDLGHSPDICFVQCAKKPTHLIARHHMEGLAARVPSIKLHYVVDTDEPYQVWSGYRGNLTSIMLGSMVADYNERDVYCCGPDPFMQSVRDMLNSLGYDMDRYHQERFGPSIEAVSEDLSLLDTVPNETSNARIIFGRSAVTAECVQTDTLLAVAKAAGLNIPSGCTMGLCGTCKVHKSSGEVHMVHNGGISEADIASGYVLACCSNPMGTVEIDV